MLIKDRGVLNILDTFRNKIKLHEVNFQFTEWVRAFVNIPHEEPLEVHHFQWSCLAALFDWHFQDQQENCFAVANYHFVRQRHPAILLNLWLNFLTRDSIATKSINTPFPHARLTELMLNEDLLSSNMRPDIAEEHPIVISAGITAGTISNSPIKRMHESQPLASILASLIGRSHSSPLLAKTVCCFTHNPFLCTALAILEVIAANNKEATSDRLHFNACLEKLFRGSFRMTHRRREIIHSFCKRLTLINSRDIPATFPKSIDTVQKIYLITENPQHLCPLHSLHTFCAHFARHWELNGGEQEATWVKSAPFLTALATAIHVYFQREKVADLSIQEIIKHDTLCLPFQGGYIQPTLRELDVPITQQRLKHVHCRKELLRFLTQVQNAIPNSSSIISYAEHAFTLRLEQSHLPEVKDFEEWHTEMFTDRVAKVGEQILSEEEIFLYCRSTRMDSAEANKIAQAFDDKPLSELIAHLKTLPDTKINRNTMTLSLLRVNIEKVNLATFLEKKLKLDRVIAYQLQTDVLFDTSGDTLYYPFEIAEKIREHFVTHTFTSPPELHDIEHQMIDYLKLMPFVRLGDSNFGDSVTKQRDAFYIVPDLLDAQPGASVIVRRHSSSSTMVIEDREPKDSRFDIIF